MCKNNALHVFYSIFMLRHITNEWANFITNKMIQGPELGC